jgi:hypothetical protein
MGVTLPEDVVRREVENTAALTPAHEGIEDLVRKVTLLEGEEGDLVEARQAREVAEGKFHSLSDMVADGV